MKKDIDFTSNAEIAREAQNLLDKAGPEKVRRFCQRFGGEDEVPIPAPAAATTPPTPNCGTSANLLIAGGTAQKVEEALKECALHNISAYADYKKLEEWQVKILQETCLSYLNSDSFKETLRTRQQEKAVYDNCIRALEALSNNVRRRTLDFNHAVDLDKLLAALTRDTIWSFDILVPKVCSGAKKRMGVTTTFPLTVPKRHMLNQLMKSLIDLAATARSIHSQAEEEFKAAYLLALRTVGGPLATNNEVARPFPKKVANEIIALFSRGYGKLFADAVVADRMCEMAYEEEG